MFNYFNLFKKTDPVCGMKKENGKGITKDNNWFCSQNCLKQYENKTKAVKVDKCCH